jgi:sulfur relay (sulfurtransferase) complex TusBCD TusD component (DsrE family)
LEENYYESNPDLCGYFQSLPDEIQNRILQSGVEISTLGELMQVSEHLKSESSD